jgi:hypothetical protein
MNTPLFDELLHKILTEHIPPVDITSGYEGTGEETEAEFPEKSEGKYSLTADQTKDVCKAVIAKLREQGGHSDKSFKEFQEEDIAPIIREVAGLSGTNSKYAARVIHTALKNKGIITDERDGTSTLKVKAPSDEQLEKIADEAEDVASSGEIIDNTGEETETTDMETTITPTKSTRFSSEGMYELQDVPAGKLRGDEADAYRTLDNSGARESTEGSDLHDALKRAGIIVSKINGILGRFVRDGILVRTDDSGSGGSGEALEAGEENMRDVEKRTFDKELGDAYRDYIQSGGGGNGHGIDFG